MSDHIDYLGVGLYKVPRYYIGSDGNLALTQGSYTGLNTSLFQFSDTPGKAFSEDEVRIMTVIFMQQAWAKMFKPVNYSPMQANANASGLTDIPLSIIPPP